MIETYRSKNGLRIVLESVPTVRSVTIGIWVRTGSRQETEQNNGISHFLEHMLFKGTKNRTAKDIAEAFDSIGGQVNAFTSKEYTCFYARVVDTYKEHALEVLTDMLFNSTFLEDEIEREKKVVMEEIKMYEDTPDDHVHDLLATASFGNHPLGRPIIGTEKQIKSFTRKTLIDYMKEFYTPSNIVVSVAGNVEHEFIYKIESLFSTFKDSNCSFKREKPTFLANKIIKNKDTEQAHLCLGYRGLAINDSRISAILIINSILGGGMSSRLFQEVREKHGLAYSVFSYHAAYLDCGLLTIYAGTNKEQVNLLQTTIKQTVHQLAEKGLTDKEFMNSKEQLKGNIMLSLESTNSRMSRNGRNELLLGRQRSLDDIINDIDAVDRNTINEVLEQLFLQDYAESIIVP
ncbi:M16 family metallopeptidase [Pseudogracilibacillus sp. SO30301A]|uniref:M16 family metallopeptidase n=1 Tax=Pseudogracilibacillus sp. SO30301A TaxID=3098291 RepID=UPI00300DE187